MSIPRPHWRKMTWTIVIWNIVMAIWLATGANSVAHQHCSNLSAQACNAAKAVGGGIGAALIIAVWIVGDLILVVLWLVTKGRACPVCGRNVRRGSTVCRCGHDFRVSGLAGSAPTRR